MDYHELQKTTAAKLREMTKEYPDITGASGLNKEQLIDLLCEKKGIEKPHKVVVGIDKATIKAEIREFKNRRAAALEAKDREELSKIRRNLHHLRGKLRRAIKIT